MTRTRPFNSASAVLLGLLALVAGAPAAQATHQTSTGSVDVREVVSGSDQRFTLTVAHPPGGGPAVNAVRIGLPGGGADPLLEVSDASSASGAWTSAPAPGGVTFTATGTGLAPGSQDAFRIDGVVDMVPTDACAAWTIQVSSDGGTSYQAVSPAAAGALTTCVRILHVQSFGIVAPAGATDATVTAGQTNACVRMELRNDGSAQVIALPRAEGIGIAVGLARSASDPPCSGSELPNGEIALGSVDTRTIDFRLTFGDAGTTTLFGRATAAGATAIEGVLPVLIQPQPKLQYANGTLIPRSVQPGTPGAVFRFTAIKGPAGSPALVLHPEATTFEFGGCPPRRLISSHLVGGGQVANVPLEFEGCDIGGLPDGRYPTVARYRYTDDNGFSADVVISGVESVRIDGTPPEVSATLALPNPACCAPPHAPAIRNGDRVTMSGSVQDASPDTGQLEACMGCTVQAQIQQFTDAGCGTAGAAALGVTVNVAGDSISGQFTGSYDPATRSARWAVTSRDEAGNATTAFTQCVMVDNVKPIIVSAETQRVGGEQNHVKVTLSECVGGTTGILDWRLDGNAVAQIVSNECQGAGAGARTTILLRAIVPFADDSPAGMLRYEPLPAVGGRLHDRTNNAMDPQSIPLEDGIPSLLW